MALPNQINKSTPGGGAIPSTIDNQIRAFKEAVEDIMGIPDATNIISAAFVMAAGGLQAARFQDTASDPSIPGELKRNGSALMYHDGTAARSVQIADGTGSSVDNGGTGLTTVTDNAYLFGNATSPLSVVGPASDGQLPIGNTGSVPTLSTLTGTTNRIIVTNGAGSITLSAPQDLHTGSSPTFNEMFLSLLRLEQSMIWVEGVTPASVENQIVMYVKEAGGQSGLFYREEQNGAEVQLPFPAGTRVPLQQTSAPPGFTKETNAAYDQAIIRLITGTVAPTGGSVGFTTLFGSGKNVDGHTLTTGEMPSHTHDERLDSSVGIQLLRLADGGTQATVQSGSNSSSGGTVVTTGSSGAGGSHTHSMTNLNIKYADFIIAIKD